MQQTKSTSDQIFVCMVTSLHNIYGPADEKEILL